MQNNLNSTAHLNLVAVVCWRQLISGVCACRSGRATGCLPSLLVSITSVSLVFTGFFHSGSTVMSRSLFVSFCFFSDNTCYQACLYIPVYRASLSLAQ